MKNRKSIIFKTIIIGLFLVSLFTESFKGTPGFFSLIFGGLTILFGKIGAFLAWFANIPFFISLFGKHKIDLKLKLSITALALGLIALTIKELPVHEGSTFSRVEISFGYYLWISSIFLLVIFNYLKLKATPKNEIRKF